MSIELTNTHWVYWRNNLEKKFIEHPLEIIQWEATRRCDMRCEHCGSPKEAVCLQDELTTEEAKAAFTQIKNDFDLSGFKFITITGGEPFVRRDLFEMIELFQSFGWVTTIQTNGNYLAQRKERIAELLKLGVRGIGLDLDGLEMEHDRLRKRLGHFQQARALIEELLKFENTLHVTVTTVVTKRNINELSLLWEMISELNPHRWRLLPVETMGRAAEARLDLEPKDYRDLLNFVHEKRLQNIHLKELVQTELGCIGWLGVNLEGRCRPYIWSCIAGRTVLGILYDGSLSACAHIDRTFVQGNVRNDRIKDVWEHKYRIFRNRLRQQLCEGCSEKEFCTIPMHKLNSSGNLRDCVFQQIQKGGEVL